MSFRRMFQTVVAVAFVGLLLTGLWFREQAVYLVGAAYYQGLMLYGRVPLDEALKTEDFTKEEVTRLGQVGRIKAYGKTIGLSATANYDTINPSWTYTIYNVSAAEPLAFENRAWWFPIVGSMPYLGFFEKDQADAKAAELESDGLDTYVRTAGAYSTLGWFEDPLLPRMLRWSEYSFANTILHELAHATVWVPGSVPFNESFANFVGDVAARRYMNDTYGPASEEVQKMEGSLADRAQWRSMMHALYADLDAVYKSGDLTPQEQLSRKQELFDSLPGRFEQRDWSDRKRWRAHLDRQSWNNATMMQFRTYNTSRDHFQAVYEAEGSDLLAFMRRIQSITDGATDPYDALKRAAQP